MQQALQLLGQSLDDTHLASAAISTERGTEDVAGLALLVSRADSRAEHVSHMARQLLGVLREFPRRDDAPLPRRGLGVETGRDYGGAGRGKGLSGEAMMCWELGLAGCALIGTSGNYPHTRQHQLSMLAPSHLHTQEAVHLLV